MKGKALFACLILALYLCVPVQAVFDQFSVPQSSTVTWFLRLENGSRTLERFYTVSGTIRVSGGPANDIQFYVKGPNNVTVLFFENVTKTAGFSFVVPTTGTYTAYLNNSLSGIIKGITLNYSIEPPILGIPRGAFFLGLMILTAAVVISIVAFVVIRLRRKPQKKPQEKAAPEVKT